MSTRNQKIIRRYSELKRLETFEDKLEYLKLSGVVGEDTFGFDRYINQNFYKSEEWKKVRNFVIARDNGCDLGSSDHPIIGERIIVHHMNPITKDDIINNNDFLLNPDYLITTVKSTHDTIHYGNSVNKEPELIERSKNDMCPWRH